MATLTSKRNERIESNLSWGDVIALLGRAPGDFTAKLYAQEMAYQAGRPGVRPLRGDQIFWAHKLALGQRDAERAVRCPACGVQHAAGEPAAALAVPQKTPGDFPFL